MSSIRAFIAVEIENESTLSNIVKWKKQLESLGLDAKFVEDENLHLTIRFLGEISLSSLEQIKEIVNKVSQMTKSFEIKIAGFGAFPNINKPRVLWIGVVEGFENLANIRKYIDTEIIRYGLRDVHKDQHEFSPHITIARLKSYRGVEKLQKYFIDYKDYFFGTSTVTQIKIKKSTLTPRGPIYSDIHIVKLL
ncbi:RNA 2',3'-cyclic phosphodiesterase [Ignisphaera sp. 4213-co]|uniref:RNA 2',3'-cyclic phosphodiesterase n=1 Tax=Ignisphaera cupida TaxID=3050454 RepID=A0ABD4Z5M7_9CREN|nr:RNA 2',3'-cyclic phosphodiesterase [Ignisphaera sp. 4213-co]MDK6028277.1 RNA 2',3'-cyclic phosphodiesterase [Ignisphaera sp. 4213-co]